MKFKLLFFLFSLFLFSTGASAQDTIFYKNGTFKIVKVTEVGEKSITYFKLESLEGAPYTISSGNVSSVSFSNGKIVNIAPLDKITVVKKSNLDSLKILQDSLKQAVFDKRKWTFSTDIFHLLFLNGNLNVDYFLVNKGFSLYFPFEIGINGAARATSISPSDLFRSTKAFTGGLGMKFHFHKKKRSSGHIMPLLEFGKVNFNYPYVDSKYKVTMKEGLANVFIASLNLGQDIYIGSHFYGGINIGTGVRIEKTDYPGFFISEAKKTNTSSSSYTGKSTPDFSNYILPSVKIGIRFGFWF